MNFFKTFSKNTQLSSFMEIRPLGAELFHANGRAGRQAGRQAERQAERQAGRQADRHDEVNNCSFSV